MDLENADLHVHSNRSDGALSIEDVVEEIKKQGTTIMAITDHDGVYGVKEAKKIAANIGGIKIIPGIEFSASGPRGEELHILGYFIDTDNPGLTQLIEDVRGARRERNVKLYEVLTEMGLHISEDDFSGIPNEGYVGKPLIARKLVEKGLLKNFSEAFKDGKFLDSKEIRGIKKRKASAEKIIRVIKEAGGLSVLAHPMKIKGIGTRGSQEFWSYLYNLARQLKDYGLGGLECFYPSHTQEEKEKILDIAETLDLFVTKGTDFHSLTEKG
ncbi:MAG: PHP domain-containing protein [Anaerovoracaceae bacterium]|nr:PHP domain-containing protein [Anaerovoracaceae bacterium]